MCKDRAMQKNRDLITVSGETYGDSSWSYPFGSVVWSALWTVMVRAWARSNLHWWDKRLIPIHHFIHKTGGMSLPLRSADLTSLQRHAASLPEVRSFFANRYDTMQLIEIKCFFP